MVDGLRHASGAVPGAPAGFSVSPDEGGVLLFGDVDVEADVRSSHDMARPGVQQDVGRVQSPYGNKAHAVSDNTHKHTLRSRDTEVSSQGTRQRTPWTVITGHTHSHTI